MIRIVADTNVIVSALAFGGMPRAVLELAEAGRCQWFHSPPIQEEVRRILAEKFRWSSAMLQKTLPPLWSIGELIIPQMTVKAVPDDPDDDRILECALSANAHFLVTGDRHLLTLSRYKSISIVTPRQFIEANFSD